MNLVEFDALSFDCYGTLIDWEAGIAAVLGPWAREHGLDLDDEALLRAYADHEARAKTETPAVRYRRSWPVAFTRSPPSSARRCRSRRRSAWRCRFRTGRRSRTPATRSSRSLSGTG